MIHAAASSRLTILAALVNALDLLVSDRALRDSLGAAGRGRAATICDPSRVLAQLADAMSSIGVPTAA